MSSPASPVQTTRLITASHGDGRLEFQKKFDEIVSGRRVTYAVNYHLLERLGSGSQGVVFLADRVGAHGFSCRVAIKLFSPAAYLSVEAYLEHMIYISNIAARLVALQQDHLLDIVNFVEFGGIQVMVMEWVDGFDLQTLLDPRQLQAREHDVKDADSIGHDPFEFVVRLFDRAAGGDQGDRRHVTHQGRSESTLTGRRTSSGIKQT